MAYATSKEKNSDTISIECCHPDETGKFNEDTYESLVRFTAYLCENLGLTEKDVIRHYDATGKDCPRYFVAHEDLWKQFLQDVKGARKEFHQ
jgi:N-acetylmuramoyl-L-alanine amidase